MVKEIIMSFALIRPSGVQFLIEIAKMIRKSGLKIKQTRFIYDPKRDQFEKLYEPHKGKEWLAGFIDSMMTGTSVAMVIEGSNAVERMRTMIGATDPLEAEKGSIRNIFGKKDGAPQERFEGNVIHGSDNIGSAAREMAIFFPELRIGYQDQTKENGLVTKKFICEHCAYLESREVQPGHSGIDCPQCGHLMEELDPVFAPT